MKHKAAPPRPKQAPDDSGAGGDDGVQRGPTRVRYAANHEGQLSIDKEISCRHIPQGKAAVEISIIHQTGIGLPQLTSALTQQCHMTTTITHALSAIAPSHSMTRTVGEERGVGSESRKPDYRGHTHQGWLR